MSTESPRTWTMRQTTEPGVGWLVDGPMPQFGEVAEVVEKAPVDAEIARLNRLAEAKRPGLVALERRVNEGVAEQKRMLGLLERILDWATPYRDSMEGEPECVADRDAVRACLREHGRLEEPQAARVDDPRDEDGPIEETCI